MGNVKISVIVPIYNVEQYIERCVRSLMEQTMKDGIEFIFINDCTPDKSMEILTKVIEDYPERADQVIMKNNPCNLGVSESRKKGIELAKGDYIGWCDSDDWCDNKMFETMCAVAESKSCDIIVCNYWEFTDRVERLIRIAHSSSPHVAIANAHRHRSFSGVLWNQIIKRGLLASCWDKIVPTNYSEDTFVLFHVYYHAKTMEIIELPLCHHRLDNEQSLVHIRDNSRKAWLIQQENLERIEKLYYQNNGWKKYHVALNAFIFERKCLYRGAFDSDRAFTHTFKHASKDILRFYDWRKMSSWKMYLYHNFQFLNSFSNRSR